LVSKDREGGISRIPGLIISFMDVKFSEDSGGPTFGTVRTRELDGTRSFSNEFVFLYSCLVGEFYFS